MVWTGDSSSGWGLHPSSAGHQAMAAQVNTDLFTL
jgi:hypothetical protein